MSFVPPQSTPALVAGNTGLMSPRIRQRGAVTGSGRCEYCRQPFHVEHIIAADLWQPLHRVVPNQVAFLNNGRQEIDTQ